MSLPARFWSLEEKSAAPQADNGGKAVAARCGLCPHGCLLEQGAQGRCGARFFDGGELRSPYLGRFTSIAVDPIEKKPLYHWRPGTAILSLGSLGCTMRCPFCQNHTIAHPQKGPGLPRLSALPPEELPRAARKNGLQSVAYTYNEPALQAEYILAAAPLLQAEGIATVLVSNGMYSPELLEALVPHTAAANIDIKTFNPKTYARLGGSLETVKGTVKRFMQAGVHVEITTLVVPGVSDSLEEFDALTAWAAAVSPELPLHISRYRPAYRFTAPPTDVALLKTFAALAKTRLRHVHIGNVPGLH